MKLLKMASNRLGVIIAAIKRCENILSEFDKNGTNGRLEIKGNTKKAEYYIIYGSGRDAKKEYIKQDKKDMAKSLAGKTYHEKMLAALVKEKDALEKFIKNYKPEKKYRLYDDMCEARKEMISPLFISVSEQVKAWQEEKYEQSDFYKDGLIYETDRGENVRSKTEVIEANAIGKRKNLDYRYEKPLYLPDLSYPIYPDFTIINKKTAKVFYLEHAGKMDDPDYANDFINKMNRYIKAGIMPGKDLWITYESNKEKFDMTVFKKILDEIEGCD